MTRRDRVDGPSDRSRDSASERPPGDPDPDGRSPSPSTDPRRIGSLAVTKSDVVDALEATARGGRTIVLRVTPPFSGRMRARLHAVDAVTADGAAHSAPDPTADAGDDADGVPDAAAPVHIPPERFVADPPPLPTVDDTEDELRASGTPYTRERHRERHQAAVEAWRGAVRERLVEEITLHTHAGSTTVSVSYLG